MNIADAINLPFVIGLDAWTRGMRRFSGAKRRKSKAERRRAKLNPECAPAYGRYRGWW